MNIENIAEYIATFRAQVVESGFKRDVKDYVNSLPSNQSNIITLRDMAQKLRAQFARIQSSDLPAGLKQILLTKKFKPFTDENYLADLDALLGNRQITQDQFFTQFNQLLQTLNTRLDQNEGELNRIETFIEPFLSRKTEEHTSENKATVSVILRDKASTTTLKELTKTLKTWNTTIPLYQQLLKIQPPEDIELVSIEKGSIDFILNLDVDVALNLTDLFKTAFKVYAAYFASKKIYAAITESYFGNKELIELDEKRDKLMLENIRQAITKEVTKQFEEAKAKHKVNPDNPTKIVERVTELVASHVVKGNDIKLLGLPNLPDEQKQAAEQAKLDLRTLANEAENARKALPEAIAQKLLEFYGDVKE